MMKLRVLVTILLLIGVLQIVFCQQNKVAKRKKEPGDNKIKPANKRIKPKVSRVKERVSIDGISKVQSIMIQVLDTGRIRRVPDTIILSAGWGLELRCRGNRIGWSHPHYQEAFEDSRLRISQHDKYSQLILVNTTAADTGNFSCWGLLCDGSECSEDDTKKGSTYIFFTERDELFVPSANYFEVVYLRPDEPGIIPCRASSPLAEVTLHRELPAEKIFVNGTQISYDVKRGFIIHQPSPEDKGVFYCRATLEGVLQSSIKYQLLYVEVPSGPPTTTIMASSTRVQYGDNLHVLCKVLGEPEVQVDFSWLYPGQQDERPIDIQDSWRLINHGIGYTTRLSQSIISVEDFETIDTGNYICTANNLRGATTVAVSVNVY
ncbi:platelet-derived growth factor receptor-like protein [Latimeria chalumnae]|uniref:platelet-derived growth factor receptor-like protein n=1 Tax=Latimeria chalumnae TaxID=7897 RepID=UPI0003C181FB|nr:PREDICTED: platelet-derived growth factor receptor-like protein [Latimeria chalumnae]|eukprot:XP_006000139.1 PREDICTED: platelet-derived growth factor receptor-like protein [Latimeria chalumnae]